MKCTSLNQQKVDTTSLGRGHCEGRISNKSQTHFSMLILLKSQNMLCSGYSVTRPIAAACGGFLRPSTTPFSSSLSLFKLRFQLWHKLICPRMLHFTKLICSDCEVMVAATIFTITAYNITIILLPFQYSVCSLLYFGKVKVKRGIGKNTSQHLLKKLFLVKSCLKMFECFFIQSKWL